MYALLQVHCVPGKITALVFGLITLICILQRLKVLFLKILSFLMKATYIYLPLCETARYQQCFN